jgi:allantoinase
MDGGMIPDRRLKDDVGHSHDEAEERMATYDLSIVNADVVLPGGAPARVDIGVRDGRIAAIAAGGIEAERTLDATGLVVLPGLVDEHFHVFRGYPWETYENATRAAIKGGVTAVVDMPLDKPPTLTAERLRDKLDAIAGACHVDYACFGGYLAEDPGEMARMAEAGASAFKLFTGGVAPPGMYPGVDDGQLLDALRRAAALGRPTTVHSENPGMVDFETARMQAEGRDDLGAWDDARPWFSETAAAQTVALAAHAAGARVVIAHVSSPETVDALDDARRRGADVWAETCHHYLCTTREACEGDLRNKWNPPTRRAASVDRLWEHVREGRIHAIGSDHAPLPKADGATVWTMPPGSGNGAEVMFPVFATQALHERDVPLGRIAELMSTTPARLFGLAPRKGAIRIGADADFAIVETNGRKVLDANDLEYHEQERWSPFEGMELRVYPVYTVLGGRVVFAEGEVLGAAGDGAFLGTTGP